MKNDKARDDRMSRNLFKVTEAINQGEYENEMEMLAVLVACQHAIVDSALEKLNDPETDQETEERKPETTNEAGGTGDRSGG